MAVAVVDMAAAAAGNLAEVTAASEAVDGNWAVAAADTEAVDTAAVEEVRRHLLVIVNLVIARDSTGRVAIERNESVKVQCGRKRTGARAAF